MPNATLAILDTTLSRTPIPRSRPRTARGYVKQGSLFPRVAASSKPDPPTKELAEMLKDFDTEKVFKDVQDRWDAVEDKTTFVVYVGGALLVLFVGSSVISAFDKLPLLPKLFQLVGLIYTSWFVYRYLLFKSSRQELIDDVEELKNKISGRE